MKKAILLLFQEKGTYKEISYWSIRITFELKLTNEAIVWEELLQHNIECTITKTYPKPAVFKHRLS
ncbi:hypothetical protein ACFFWB_27410 [Flavobacterium procerum]|uniref:hypothetical protein n=1 Tax=Flavobacterium procerum TaxID=1455569 RepID=UPI0035EF302E